MNPHLQSEMLKSNFERTVVGFDLRRKSSLSNLFLTSYNDSVRYEEIYEHHQSELSGLNLFYVDPSDIPSFEIPTDAQIVAFDLPEELVNHLSKGNVSTPQPLPKGWSATEWEFMGFDVVDAITQTSAFYGFDWSPSEIMDFAQKGAFCFNPHGLIDDEGAAIKAAAYFDDLIKEHSPFAPCGIWLKRSSPLSAPSRRP